MEKLMKLVRIIRNVKSETLFDRFLNFFLRGLLEGQVLALIFNHKVLSIIFASIYEKSLKTTFREF